MSVYQLKKLKELESKLSSFKRRYPELALENNALKHLIEKNLLRSAEKREAVGYLTDESLSIRQVCVAINLSLSVYYYRFKRKAEDTVIMRHLEQLAEKYPAYGFRQMYHLLRLEEYRWNHKRVYRVYVMMGLNMRRKRKRRLPARVKTPHILPIQSNITWSADFMHDSLSNGRQFSTFNVIDDHNRKALMSTIDTSLSARGVFTRELEQTH